MSAKMGRPKSDTPKDTTIQFRVDEVLLDKLDSCCKRAGLSKSEVIRLGIEKVYQEVIGKKV